MIKVGVLLQMKTYCCFWETDLGNKLNLEVSMASFGVAEEA